MVYLYLLISLAIGGYLGYLSYIFWQEIKNLTQFKETAEKELAELRPRVKTLARFQTCVDADAEAKRILQKVQQIRQNVDDYVELQQNEGKKIVEDALAKANQILNDADEQVTERLEEVSRYQERLDAIEHQIKGYGATYLVPADSLIDSVAAELGYTEPGEKLKEVRKEIRSMVAQNEAVDCNYSEKRRRTTAMIFVTDAFLGKLESIIAKTKKDNYGTLQQELRDAYNMVNMHGEAFSNAHITENFFRKCSEQIRLLSALHEIKEKQKEEQRAIREQMKEEEKARKEMEKAIKEAAKREQELQEAMRKEQEIIERTRQEMLKKMDEATAEQRAALQAEYELQQAKYQQDMTQLQERLAEAEAKNQRALSMAQQTKAGNVYIISNLGSFGENVYKIGMTRRLDPMDRVKELGDASVPFSFDVHAMIYSEDAPSLETALHRKFALNQVNKVNRRKEFFSVSIADLRKEVENMGIEASWTMAAEAREYYETKIIEQNIAIDATARQSWLEKQSAPETALESLGNLQEE